MDIQHEVELLEKNMISGLISDKEYDDALNALIKDGNRINHYNEDEYHGLQSTDTRWS